MTFDLSYGHLSTLDAVFSTAGVEACPDEVEVAARLGPYEHALCNAGETLGGILHTHFYANRFFSGLSCAICHRVWMQLLSIPEMESATPLVLLGSGSPEADSQDAGLQAQLPPFFGLALHLRVPGPALPEG